jgi:hypothetical protein
VTRKPEPPHASVYFPLAGDLDRGLAQVHVIDWGEHPHTRLTHAGPNANQLQKDDEIERTIRTERLCGGCRPVVAAGQVMVELKLADGAQICGASYTLALALADKLARGCLPGLADRTVIASGVVKHDGSIAAVGRIDEKLAGLARTLTRQPMPAPLLVLPRANLDVLTTEARHLLRGLIAAGVQCVGVADLAEMESPWPRETETTGPGPDPIMLRVRDWLNRRLGMPTKVFGRWWRLILAVVVVAALILGLLIWLPPPLCAKLSTDPAIIEQCWAPALVTFRADCTMDHLSGGPIPRHCPSGTCLAADDAFSLEVRPTADGWLAAYYVDAAGQVWEDLRPDHRPWSVRKDQKLPLTLPTRTNPPAVRPPRARFYAVLTRAPLPEGATPVQLRSFLDAVAEIFVLCGDPQ